MIIKRDVSAAFPAGDYGTGDVVNEITDEMERNEYIANKKKYFSQLTCLDKVLYWIMKIALLGPKIKVVENRYLGIYGGELKFEKKIFYI